MTRKTRILAFALALVFLGASLPSLAEGGALGKNWWKNPRMQERLGLSAEQSARIDEIALASQEEQIDLHAALSKARLRLEKVLYAETLDDAELGRLTDEVINLQCQAIKLRMVTRVEIAKVLDAGQRRQLEQIHEHLRQKRQERRELRQDRRRRR